MSNDYRAWLLFVSWGSGVVCYGAAQAVLFVPVTYRPQLFVIAGVNLAVSIAVTLYRRSQE